MLLNQLRRKCSFSSCANDHITYISIHLFHYGAFQTKNTNIKPCPTNANYSHLRNREGDVLSGVTWYRWATLLHPKASESLSLSTQVGKILMDSTETELSLVNAARWIISMSSSLYSLQRLRKNAFSSISFSWDHAEGIVRVWRINVSYKNDGQQTWPYAACAVLEIAHYYIK